MPTTASTESLPPRPATGKSLRANGRSWSAAVPVIATQTALTSSQLTTPRAPRLLNSRRRKIVASNSLAVPLAVGRLPT
jgi:hypothetical protein